MNRGESRDGAVPAGAGGGVAPTGAATAMGSVAPTGGATAGGAVAAAVAWDCPACGHANQGPTCEACGVALRHYEDPPLDLPFTPQWTELPSFWLGLGWALAAAAGAVFLLAPELRDKAGLGTTFLAFEVATAGAAMVSSWLTAAWERRFNQVVFDVPAHVRAGEPFKVTLRLVPYGTVEAVDVRLGLVDRYYHRSGDKVETRSRGLETRDLLRGGRLRGRRATVLEVEFLAPFPATPHTDVRAEITADVIGAVGWVVPALRQTARNLRQHGGYYVEARLRVGLLRRTLQKRVVSYHVGSDVFVG